MRNPGTSSREGVWGAARRLLAGLAMGLGALGFPYDAARKGFDIAFTIDEGDRYQFGTIDIKPNVGAVDVAALRGALTMTQTATSTTRAPSTRPSMCSPSP